jgi:LacI family transcriptional regulator
MPGEAASTVTIRDVARRAGVSVSSVSRALSGHPNVSDELRRRVARAALELEYQPSPAAQRMRGGASGLVGCVVGAMNRGFLGTIYEGVERVLSARGYSMIVASAHGDTGHSVADLRRLARRIDGLIFTPGAAALDSSGLAVSGLGIPLVLLDHEPPPGATHVSAALSDFARGTQAAVAHLTALGHRRIALIGGPTSWRPGCERLRGYRAGLAAAQLTPEPGLIHQSASSEVSGYVEATMLLSSPNPPTAIVNGANFVLPGVLRAIRERGRKVGRDLALVACDDLDLCQAYDPPITVVARNLPMVGQTMAHLLFKTIERGGGQVVTLPTQLIVRESSSFSLPSSLAPRQRPDDAVSAGASV